MIFFSIMLWLAGAMFTAGYISNEDRPYNEQMRYFTPLIWPLMLGTVLSDKQRSQAYETKGRHAGGV